LGSVTYCDLSIVLVDGSKETQMNLAGHLGILSAKTAPTRLGGELAAAKKKLLS
jgi:hypothetical protein